MTRELAVLAKYWQPGQVKTRLAQSVGNELAADLHRAMLETTLRRFGDVADRRTLAFTPSSRRDEFAAIIASSWQLDPQTKGDLGARMRHVLRRAIERGVSRVVLVGSDSPTLPVSFVEQAFELLRKDEVVLGPSSDGGYYLLGAAGVVPEIFDGVAWGTGDVWQQTVSRLAAAGHRYAELPDWYDVDDLHGLARLGEELAGEDCQGACFQPLRDCGVVRSLRAPGAAHGVTRVL